MKITLLHTSNAHVKRFDRIAESIGKSIEIEHHVNEELLEIAKSTGQIDRVHFEKELMKIRENNGKFIICTCSTYGNLCDENDKVYRIDKPIAEYIVSNFSNIGIAYTIASTKKISQALIEEIAKINQKPINLFEIDCQSCWNWFEKGEFEKYEREIANQIKNKADKYEVVFLAQASMEGAKNYLKNENYKVVSSPEYGMKNYIEKISKEAGANE